MYGINKYSVQPEAIDTSMDEEYDYSAGAAAAASGAVPTGTPTPTTASSQGLAQNRSYQQHNQNTSGTYEELLNNNNNNNNGVVSTSRYASNNSNNNNNNNQNNTSRDSDKIIDPDEYYDHEQGTDEALQDLAELEELQNEAERMKAVGNKHMAAQEYVQAYNAYSAALQLSPVGPSSHVFLSNRAAALLSLKRYPAAATDARRAVALAPTFGKAHARLGQALYFLKDYQAAVHAYEDALRYEPDNAVTQTYLEKAVHKLEKQQRARSAGSTDVSVLTETTGLTTAVGQMSIATDPEGKGIMQDRQYAGPNQTARAAMLHATAKQPVVGTSPTGASSSNQNNISGGSATTGTSGSQQHAEQQQQSQLQQQSLLQQDDPEFEEALRIQQRANAFLVNKKYRQAIEEYTAALFLVPDDVNLSPDLHLGRAHALNGSRRHESARNDAVLALRLQESAAAYSTLAKSLFYMKEYQAAIDAFDACEQQLPQGEVLGLFDQAYLEKAQKALAEEAASLDQAGRITKGGNGKEIPKLPPPRFVPREEAVHSPSVAARSMPKTWPQQSPTSRIPLQCGPERDVVCLSEGLGVKLNRGSDGVVRVLSVTDSAAAPALVRRGEIRVGDVVREAAGVDIRRPITNIMWGDTVALIKMAPRPITLTVAEELSPVPPAVREEQRKALLKHGPSRGSDEGAVVKAADDDEDDEDIVEMDGDDVVEPPKSPKVSAKPNLDTVTEKSEEDDRTPASSVAALSVEDDNEDDDIESLEDEEESQSTPVKNTSMESSPSKSPTAVEVTRSLRDEEEKMVGGEILFLRDPPPAYGGWDTLRWMAHNGARKVNFCQPVFRMRTTPHKRKGLPMFWKQGVGKQYEARSLIVYDEPSLILVVRRPTSMEEINQLIGLEENNWDLNPETALTSYWVLESVADPASCKLRLSPLTTATSVAAEHADDRERSCFQVLTPTETISLSAVHVREDTKKKERSFKDSGAFLETLSVEATISQAICDAHSHSSDLGATDRDIAWKHQVVIGSLHSLVLSGNPKFLEDGLKQAREATVLRGDIHDASDPNHLPARIIDAVDDNGYTALYYACKNKMSAAVQCLVNAGATVHFHTEDNEISMLHVSARKLDDLSLASLLAAPSRPDPNVLDKRGRTPMYVALVEGSAMSKTKDPEALGRCIAVLKAWGGKMLLAESPPSLRNPISALAYMNLPDYIAVALDHVPHRFPLPDVSDTVPGADPTMSLGALYQYPVHSALVALRKHMRKSTESKSSSSESTLIRTLRVLFEHGFEPNERLDRAAFKEKTAFDEFVGFAPIQILAVVALELDASKAELDAGIVNSSSKLIADVAELLVKSGARLSLDPPPTERQRSKTETAAGEVELSSARTVEILTQKLDGDKQIMALLGGELRLSSAFKEWTEMKKVATTSAKELLEDEKANIDDSPSAGGSDSLSCAICWSVFGSLMNRKHKCRVTRKFVCDPCSTKRLIQVTEYRLSDGQFNLARFDAAREQEEKAAAEKEKERSKFQSSEQARAAARLDRLEAEEQSNRDSLFGGMLDATAKILMGEEPSGTEATTQQVNGIAASLDQTRDALNQRGEKLGELNDKSAKLVETSADFAKVAKDLRKQSEGGLFW